MLTLQVTVPAAMFPPVQFATLITTVFAADTYAHQLRPLAIEV